MSQNSASYQTADDRRGASEFNSIGVKAYNTSDYAEAAKNFQAAVNKYNTR